MIVFLPVPLPVIPSHQPATMTALDRIVNILLSLKRSFAKAYVKRMENTLTLKVVSWPISYSRCTHTALCATC